MVSIQYKTAATPPEYGVFCAPIVIEGVNELEVLCPISKLTGNRENPLQLLNKLLPPDKAQILGGILQDLPATSNDSRLSDEDRFSLVKSRLLTGTPSEDAQWMSYLSSVADVLNLEVPPLSSSVDSQLDSNSVEPNAD